MEALHPKIRKVAQLLERAAFARSAREDLALDTDFDPAPVYHDQAVALATCLDLQSEFSAAYNMMREQF